jgi:predicted nucleic acid-binding protein
MIVLDTNVFSEILRPRPDRHVVAWLARQDGADIRFTTVGEAEVLYGLALLPPGRRRDDLADAIEAILEDDFRGRILAFDRAAALAYATIAASRRAAGRPISSLDAQIAAIARVHEAVVATRNTRDFTGCGIDVIDPWSDHDLRR